MINAGKVKHGSVVEISLCSSKDHFATVHKVVCCFKNSKVFCCFNITKVVLFRCNGQITWALCCSQPKAPHCSACSWRGIFLFLNISKAGMLWQQEYDSTTSQLRGNQFLKLIWHDMKCLGFFGKGTIDSVGGPRATQFVLRFKI